MEKIFIKPARPTLIIRHPEKLKHIIPQEGEWVVLTPQWQRYLDAGDVVEAVPAEEKKSSKGGDK